MFAIQPNLFFDNNGNMKCFGINSNDPNDNTNANTFFPLILFVPFIAILSYLIILIIEMIYT